MIDQPTYLIHRLQTTRLHAAPVCLASIFLHVHLNLLKTFPSPAWFYRSSAWLCIQSAILLWQIRPSVRPSVCLSVRLSVCPTICLLHVLHVDECIYQPLFPSSRMCTISFWALCRQKIPREFPRRHQRTLNIYGGRKNCDFRPKSPLRPPLKVERDIVQSGTSDILLMIANK